MRILLLVMYMNKVNSIRIFFILTVMFCICCYQAAAWKGFDSDKNQKETEESELFTIEEPEEETEYSVLPVLQTFDYKYVIVEEGDYLTVYYSDRDTVYEYTDIRYSDLEDSLRQKIRKGYCIKDESALFGFLENYSS